MTEDVSTVPPHELRIGVTGHRQFADAPAVARAVERLLDYIADSLHRTSSAPVAWTVVSPIAKGADRIVADAVLARPNARLHVITPVPLDDYRRDFVEAADRQEFERLLSRASSVRELGVPHATTDVTTAPVAVERPLAYLHVGEQVAERCNILICIWNGRAANGVGGTTDIVRYALQRKRTALWILADRADEPATLLKSVHDPGPTNSQMLLVHSEPLPQRFEVGHF